LGLRQERPNTKGKTHHTSAVIISLKKKKRTRPIKHGHTKKTPR